MTLSAGGSIQTPVFRTKFMVLSMQFFPNCRLWCNCCTLLSAYGPDNHTNRCFVAVLPIFRRNPFCDCNKQATPPGSHLPLVAFKGMQCNAHGLFVNKLVTAVETQLLVLERQGANPLTPMRIKKPIFPALYFLYHQGSRGGGSWGPDCTVSSIH